MSPTNDKEIHEKEIDTRESSTADRATMNNTLDEGNSVSNISFEQNLPSLRRPSGGSLTSGVSDARTNTDVNRSSRSLMSVNSTSSGKDKTPPEIELMRGRRYNEEGNILQHMKNAPHILLDDFPKSKEQEGSLYFSKLAVDKSLTTPFEENKAPSLSGSERHDAVLIVVKVSHALDNAVNRIAMSDFYDILTDIGKRYRVARVRTFGGCWVGICGFHASWGLPELDCHKTVLMACEVHHLQKYLTGGTLSTAIDFGNVVGSYANSSLTIDIYGQEIRWPLMMVELGLCEILINDSVKKILTSSRKKNISCLQWKARKIDKIPWNITLIMTVTFIQRIRATIQHYYTSRELYNIVEVREVCMAAHPENLENAKCIFSCLAHTSISCSPVLFRAEPSV